MKVHLYATCWNEERMLPFFLRHYESVVDQFIIYDDGSSDSSLAILRKCPKAVIVPFSTDGSLSYVERLQRLYNDFWKTSRGLADWVIICNIDEHLYEPSGLRGYLRQCRKQGITVIPAQGFEMVADAFPDTSCLLCDTVRQGMPLGVGGAGIRDKICVFNPGAVTEIDYACGRHHAAPRGKVVCPGQGTLRLLHYKYLGLDYLRSRYAELAGRRRVEDVVKGYGFQYQWDEAALAHCFAKVKQQAVTAVHRAA